MTPQEAALLIQRHNEVHSRKEPFAVYITEALKMAVVALEIRTPKKPIFVDTRFRNHGRHISDGVSLSKCYKCPTCSSHIFHVWDSEKCCVHCGQVLDWSDEK